MAPNGKRKEPVQRRERHQSGVRKRTPYQADASSIGTGRDGSAAEDASVIDRLLDETAALLAQTPEAPLRRELYLVVERYRRALGEWSTQAPTQLQRNILLDCVKALSLRVASRSYRKARR